MASDHTEAVALAPSVTREDGEQPWSLEEVSINSEGQPSTNTARGKPYRSPLTRIARSSLYGDCSVAFVYRTTSQRDPVNAL